jgi:hypothetical protein
VAIKTPSIRNVGMSEANKGGDGDAHVQPLPPEGGAAMPRSCALLAFLPLHFHSTFECQAPI